MRPACLWCRLLLHVGASAHLGYALYYEYRFTELPALAVQLRLDPAIGGKFKYLTFLSELLQFAYNLLALCQDVHPQRAVRKWRDYLLASCVLPLALTVAVTYWTLCVINRDMIYPEFMDLIYPKWLNHTQHSCVVLYALLDLCSTPHSYPERRKGLAGVGAILICYLLWLQLVYYWTGGIWIYPFLDAFNGPLRVCFYLLILALSFGYYLLGEQLNFVLWKYRSMAM